MEEEEVGLPGWGGHPVTPTPPLVVAPGMRPRAPGTVLPTPCTQAASAPRSTAHRTRPGAARLSPQWLACAPGPPPGSVCPFLGFCIGLFTWPPALQGLGLLWLWGLGGAPAMQGTGLSVSSCSPGEPSVWPTCSLFPELNCRMSGPHDAHTGQLPCQVGGPEQATGISSAQAGLCGGHGSWTLQTSCFALSLSVCLSPSPVCGKRGGRLGLLPRAGEHCGARLRSLPRVPRGGARDSPQPGHDLCSPPSPAPR